MKHFLLFYEYGADYLERRVPLRAAHIEHGRAAAARGELEIGGACIDAGPPLAVLLFKCESRDPVEAFARADPYVVNGLVDKWSVREWTTVLGPGALMQA